MKDLLELLKSIRTSIGERGFSLIALGIVVAEFGDKVFGKDHPQHHALITAASCVPFVAGLSIGLFRLLSPYFRTGAGRGLCDGLFAGTLAGLAGGSLGFGWHTDGYVESHLTRILLCTVFSTPIGGLMGLFISAFGPDIKIIWRKQVSGFLCAMAFVFATYGIALTRIVPDMEGRGIVVSDIELMFESYLVFMVSLCALQRCWRWRQWFARVSLALMFIIVLRVGIVLCPDPEHGGSLAEWEYTADSDEAALGFTVAVGSSLVVAGAALALRENRLAHLADNLFERRSSDPQNG